MKTLQKEIKRLLKAEKVAVKKGEVAMALVIRGRRGRMERDFLKEAGF